MGRPFHPPADVVVLGPACPDDGSVGPLRLPEDGQAPPLRLPEDGQAPASAAPTTGLLRSPVARGRSTGRSGSLLAALRGLPPAAAVPPRPAIAVLRGHRVGGGRPPFFSPPLRRPSGAAAKVGGGAAARARGRTPGLRPRPHRPLFAGGGDPNRGPLAHARPAVGPPARPPARAPALRCSPGDGASESSVSGRTAAASESGRPVRGEGAPGPAAPTAGDGRFPKRRPTRALRPANHVRVCPFKILHELKRGGPRFGAHTPPSGRQPGRFPNRTNQPPSGTVSQPCQVFPATITPNPL